MITSQLDKEPAPVCVCVLGEFPAVEYSSSPVTGSAARTQGVCWLPRGAVHHAGRDDSVVCRALLGATNMSHLHS